MLWTEHCHKRDILLYKFIAFYLWRSVAQKQKGSDTFSSL